MTIGEYGQVEKAMFWPAEEIIAAFKRVNDALGKENEIAEMRLFIHAMNYFYDHASMTQGDLDKNEMAEVCRLATKGLLMELGMMESEEKTT
jgi:hypothetical protein